jgi:hypothetical protein
MCRVCLGHGEFFTFDTDDPAFLLVDCPRSCDGTGHKVAELCPCMENFGPNVIAKAVASLRAGSPEHPEDPADDSEDDEVQDEYTPLCEALKWVSPDSEQPPIPLTGPSANDLLWRLRAWAEQNKEIRIPHPKASLLLHLIDCGMVEFGTMPKTGSVVFRSKGAKEEFTKFIAVLNRSYEHDELTVLELLLFAYGLSNWKFDEVALRRYARGKDTTEIHTGHFNVTNECGRLDGHPAEIEAVVREAYGCLDKTND